MQITKGKISGAQKIVIYGPEGIGKSTFASQFPNPLFTDTEGSTKHMDVLRLPNPSSWTMLLEQVDYVKQNYKTLCETYVIDTADWAEKLCIAHVCSKAKKDGIEEFGYGKGYTYLEEEFGRLLNKLSDLIDLGINVVVTAHAQMRKFEQPDELGAYDRWELKLQKKTAPLLKEWADMLLFANYKTHVVNVDGQGVAKGKNKGRGRDRVMYAVHHACWDAKNRHDLPEELPFEFNSIAHCITVRQSIAPKEEIEPLKPSGKIDVEPMIIPEPLAKSDNTSVSSDTYEVAGVPKNLADLMSQNNVKIQELQAVVAQRGYYPADTPVQNYDTNFIDGVLVGAWEQVFGMIKMNRDGFRSLSPQEEKELPFN